MSILVCLRLGDGASPVSPEDVKLTGVQHKDAVSALAAWGLSNELVQWREAFPDAFANSWESALLEERNRGRGVNALMRMARQGTGLAIWYAGFPDDVPRVSTPEEFVAEVESQLASGEDEPACVFLLSEIDIPG